jgi:hypothetical protein
MISSIMDEFCPLWMKKIHRLTAFGEQQTKIK